MARYSAERKSAILKKLLPPENRTVADVAREEGMSSATLYNWRQKARERGVPVPGQKNSSDNWSPEAKFAVVVETATMSESELSQYCREKGLYPEQVSAWRAACVSGTDRQAEQSKQARDEIKRHKKKIKTLERELNRKDKALAETAALLALRKKLDALWESDQEDN